MTDSMNTAMMDVDPPRPALAPPSGQTSMGARPQSLPAPQQRGVFTEYEVEEAVDQPRRI